MTRALVIAATLGLTLGRAHAGGSPWESLMQEGRRRCAALVEEATRLAADRHLDQAVASAKSAAAGCPGDTPIQERSGELLLDAHQYADARRLLERARTLASSSPLPRDRELMLAFHLGFAREVTGDLEGAVVEHRRLAAMGGLPAPNQYLVHYNLGDELMALGRLDDAIEAYRRAVVLAPGRPVVRLALAVALDRDGQLDQSHAELAGVLALDPDLRAIAAEDYVFVPAADIHYYRAVALAERGAVADARLALRAFLVELPGGPYSAHARDRLAELERRVDPRELDVTDGTLDTRAIARALGPHVAALESCLPPQRLIHLRLQVSKTGVHPDPQQPAADCLIRVLNSMDMTSIPVTSAGVVAVPLAGRRAAASLQ